MKKSPQILIPTLILGTALVFSRLSESMKHSSESIHFRINEIRATLSSKDYTLLEAGSTTTDTSIGIGAIMVDENGVQNRLSIISKDQGFQATVVNEFGFRLDGACENVGSEEPGSIKFECRVKTLEDRTNIITLTLNY